MPCNYIVITGGVISGLGKGVLSASIAKLLQARGFRVSAIKIDPYLNIDAGTLRPTEHGEVWVTNDGGEIDQDFGHYERFLNIDIPRENGITSGQIYRKVIENERSGKYLGRTVEVIPHFTDEVKRRITLIGEKGFDFVIVEIGGTVGDYENLPFLDAVRQMRFQDSLNVLFLHLVYVPIPKHLGEAKTKPAQHSVRNLTKLGVYPDFLICRSENVLDSERKRKLSLFCNVKPENVWTLEDVSNIYEIPIILEKQDVCERILDFFSLKNDQADLSTWRSVLDKIKTPSKKVVVGMIGKYVNSGRFVLKDSYVSVNEALNNACAHIGVALSIKWINADDIKSNPSNALSGMNGIIVPGGFGESGVDGKIEAIKFARENNLPFLGLCYGLQLAVVEFARNVCGLDAHTTEIEPNTKNPVVCVLPEQVKILSNNEFGSSMRLGAYPAILKQGSKAYSIYLKPVVNLRHRHRYEINPDYHEVLEKNGLVISGNSPSGLLAEFIELPSHKFFVGTQAHPEFSSRFESPEPLFKSFIEACISSA